MMESDLDASYMDDFDPGSPVKDSKPAGAEENGTDTVGYDEDFESASPIKTSTNQNNSIKQDEPATEEPDDEKMFSIPDDHKETAQSKLVDPSDAPSNGDIFPDVENLRFPSCGVFLEASETDDYVQDEAVEKVGALETVKDALQQQQQQQQQLHSDAYVTVMNTPASILTTQQPSCSHLMNDAWLDAEPEYEKVVHEACDGNSLVSGNSMMEDAPAAPGNHSVTGADLDALTLPTQQHALVSEIPLGLAPQDVPDHYGQQRSISTVPSPVSFEVHDHPLLHLKETDRTLESESSSIAGAPSENDMGAVALAQNEVELAPETNNDEEVYYTINHEAGQPSSVEILSNDHSPRTLQREMSLAEGKEEIKQENEDSEERENPPYCDQENSAEPSAIEAKANLALNQLDTETLNNTTLDKVEESHRPVVAYTVASVNDVDGEHLPNEPETTDPKSLVTSTAASFMVSNIVSTAHNYVLTNSSSKKALQEALAAAAAQQSLDAELEAEQSPVADADAEYESLLNESENTQPIFTTGPQKDKNEGVVASSSSVSSKKEANSVSSTSSVGSKSQATVAVPTNAPNTANVTTKPPLPQKISLDNLQKYTPPASRPSSGSLANVANNSARKLLRPISASRSKSNGNLLVEETYELPPRKPAVPRRPQSAKNTDNNNGNTFLTSVPTKPTSGDKVEKKPRSMNHAVRYNVAIHCIKLTAECPHRISFPDCKNFYCQIAFEGHDLLQSMRKKCNLAHELVADMDELLQERLHARLEAEVRCVRRLQGKELLQLREELEIYSKSQQLTLDTYKKVSKHAYLLHTADVDDEDNPKRKQKNSKKPSNGSPSRPSSRPNSPNRTTLSKSTSNSTSQLNNSKTNENKSNEKTTASAADKKEKLNNEQLFLQATGMSADEFFYLAHQVEFIEATRVQHMRSVLDNKHFEHEEALSVLRLHGLALPNRFLSTLRSGYDDAIDFQFKKVDHMVHYLMQLTIDPIKGGRDLSVLPSTADIFHVRRVKKVSAELHSLHRVALGVLSKLSEEIQSIFCNIHDEVEALMTTGKMRGVVPRALTNTNVLSEGTKSDNKKQTSTKFSTALSITAADAEATVDKNNIKKKKRRTKKVKKVRRVKKKRRITDSGKSANTDFIHSNNNSKTEKKKKTTKKSSNQEEEEIDEIVDDVEEDEVLDESLEPDSRGGKGDEEDGEGYEEYSEDEEYSSEEEEEGDYENEDDETLAGEKVLSNDIHDDHPRIKQHSSSIESLMYEDDFQQPDEVAEDHNNNDEADYEEDEGEEDGENALNDELQNQDIRSSSKEKVSKPRIKSKRGKKKKDKKKTRPLVTRLDFIIANLKDSKAADKAILEAILPPSLIPRSPTPPDGRPDASQPMHNNSKRRLSPVQPPGSNESALGEKRAVSFPNLPPAQQHNVKQLVSGRPASAQPALQSNTMPGADGDKVVVAETEEPFHPQRCVQCRHRFRGAGIRQLPSLRQNDPRVRRRAHDSVSRIDSLIANFEKKVHISPIQKLHMESELQEQLQNYAMQATYTKPSSTSRPSSPIQTPSRPPSASSLNPTGNPPTQDLLHFQFIRADSLAGFGGGYDATARQTKPTKGTGGGDDAPPDATHPVYCSWTCLKRWIHATLPPQQHYHHDLLVDLAAGEYVPV